MRHSPISITMSATEFKAKCLDIFDKLAARELDQVLVTKRGKVVTIVSPPQAASESCQGVLDAMKGSVTIPDDLDLTEPVFEGVTDAELGILHR